MMNCPYGFPDAGTYKELMEDSLLAYKKMDGKAHAVAAIGSISKINDKNSMTIGAVMPSAILDSDTELDNKVCILLMIRHFCWSCMLPGANSEFPSTVNSMLDCGMHMVLISNSLVDNFGFCCFHLPNLIPVTAALQEGGIKANYLYEYIKISVSSSDNA
jgi:hypothetical protein